MERCDIEAEALLVPELVDRALLEAGGRRRRRRHQRPRLAAQVLESPEGEEHRALGAPLVEGEPLDHSLALAAARHEPAMPLLDACRHRAVGRAAAVARPQRAHDAIYLSEHAQPLERVVAARHVT
eukprot:scaffold95753_cov70-Phaeocystis_antarctica.AAC.7